MSKLVLFLFLGVCVMAVHMTPADNEDDVSDEVLEGLLDALEPDWKQKALESEGRINIKKEWNKAKPVLKEIWKEAKPIVIEAGKVAAEAAVAGVVG